MSPTLHFERLLACLLAVLLVTAAIPAAMVPPSSAAASPAKSDDAARLTINERSDVDLRSWVAPRSADLSNLSAVGAARASGNLTQSSAVTKNDTLVLELRASDLDGAIAAQNGSNTTERFFHMLEGDAAELRVRQTNPGPEVRAIEIHLAEDSARVVADSVNDSYYVVVNLREANATRGEREAEIRRRHEYEANFSVARSSSLTANGTESATTRFAVVEPTAELTTAGERREFAEPAPNWTLYGSTSLPPGSAVTVELISKDGDRRFSETVRVRNGSDGGGEFAATFDLSAVPEGTNFTVTVEAESYPGLDFDRSPVVVSEPTAQVELSSAQPTGVSLGANLSHGGFVAVRRGSVDGDLLGYSQYLDADNDENGYVSLDPDLESNATLVTVAYRDTDRDGEFDPETDEPYTDGEYDHRVAVSKTVTVEEPEPTTATTSETTESSMRGGTTTEVVTESTDSADSHPPGVGSPGFGILPAVVALLAVALLARGR